MTASRPRRVFRIAAAAASGSLLIGMAACTASPTMPVVDTSQEKPFVLEGVSNLTEIAQLTGPDGMNDTESAAVAGTDLGSMTNLGDRTYFFFGDTFGERAPDAVGGQGGIWRSNAAAWTTDADPSDGISFDGWTPTDELGWAQPLIEGEHDSNDGEGEVTKIPTHGFAIGDSLYVSYMSVSHWGEPGAWDANYAGLVKSTDRGETWTALESPRWPGDSNFIQVAPVIVSDGGRPFVYLWAIPAGRFGGVALMRVPATEEAVEDADAYSYFAGADPEGEPRWDADMDAAELVVEGTIGELSVMWSDYLERWIMTYSDGGNAYIREGLTPWGPWDEPVLLASAADYPGLYSPYLNPRYVTEGGRRIFFSMSLWGPYNVFWFSVDLDKAS
ncbi:DUF4185 domain-containing protein [Microbacterium timonense]|uniref:DUF4185 domain-containing protein n=1 Tax=Microbacterium timonense TaxID=2086576 RepID=UPI000D109A5A|nr:DUF4185 domain-containing protein [Microbacterium timonense]